jgi:hypothetical protein
MSVIIAHNNPSWGVCQMLERINTSSQQLVNKQTLNSDLTLMLEHIPGIMANSLNGWLRSLRTPAITMMKKEAEYAASSLRELTSLNSRFLFDTKTYYLNKIDSENILDDDWDNLIHHLKIYSPANLKGPGSNKDIKFCCAIRHAFDLLFKEHSPLADDLNSAIEKIDKIESFNYQDVHDKLLSLSYHAVKTITPEYIQKFSPAITLLKEKNLLSKINFLRLILCVNPAAHDIRRGSTYTQLYSIFDAVFYQLSPAAPETTLAFIARMAELDILTQKNLELLFKVIALKVGNRNVNTLEEVLEGFKFACLFKNVDNHNDLFETFMNERHHNSCALNDEERLLADVTDSDPAELARIYSIENYLDSIRRQLTKRLELTGKKAEEEEKSSLVEYCDQITTKHEDVDNIFQYMPSLAKMAASLLQDNIHTDFNLQLLLRFADKAASMHAAYQLLRENKTYGTPQEVFDVLIENVAFVDSIVSMMLWLQRPLRTPEKFKLILHNASYVPDLLAVCRFEYSVHSFREISATRVQVAEMIFMKNMTIKMEYLSALHKIYDFVTLHNVGHLSQTYMGLEVRLKFVASIAAGLAEGSTDNMSHEEAYNLYSRVDSNASAEAVATSKKWLQTLAEINRCELVRINLWEAPSPIEASLVKCNAGYILNRKEIYYVNKLHNEFKKISITDDQYIRLCNLNTFRNTEFLTESECGEITKIIGHTHDRIPESSFRRFSHIFTHDSTQVLQGYLLLYSQVLLSQQWEELLQKYPAYAVTLAKALIKLKQNNLLEEQYTDLLDVRPELALSIAIVLAGYANKNSLTYENFTLLKNNLPSATALAQMFEPTHNEETARIIDEPQRLLLSGGADNTQLIKSIREETKEKPRTSQKPLAIQPEAKQDLPLRQKDIQKPSEQEAEFITEVIKRCRKDFNRNALFSTSPFLKMAAVETPTLATIKSYVINKPRSRTAEQYMHVKVEHMQSGDLKNFMQDYLKDYQFKWYQRSQLVDKFFAGKINSINDVIRHASSDQTNRTNQVLKKYRL